METIKRTIECEMSDTEKMELGDRVATLEIEIEEVEGRKKAAVTSFNGIITEKQATCLALSKQLKTGMSTEEIECYFALNEPKVGMKQLYRFDNSEPIGEPEQMSEFDGQEKLEFPDNVELENIIFDVMKQQSGNTPEDEDSFIELTPIDLSEVFQCSEVNLDMETATKLSEGLLKDFPHPGGSQLGILIEQNDFPKLRAILRDTLNEKISLRNPDAEEPIINIPDEN
jgi:ribosomal protein L19